MSVFRRWFLMMILCMSGGIIYFLPFLGEVYYLPLQKALAITKTQLGILESVFGITCLIFCFPGGWLADRFSPRKLISIACISTGIAGFYYATFPSYRIALALHVIWGITITLTFWSAMIKATRNWAPANRQGRAFGILEGGRGVAEAVTSSIMLVIFAKLGSGKLGLAWVIILFSIMDILVGVLAWLVLEDSTQSSSNERDRIRLSDIITVLKMPVVWLISIVILSSYTAYWGLDFFTPYATEVFGMSVVFGGSIAVAKMWMKPIPGATAGFLADRIGISRTVAWSFLILIVSFALSAAMPDNPALIALVLVNIAVASSAVFASRGVYFALLEEGNIPLALTGTAVGTISVIGYTPDIFMPVLGGVLLDRYPGAKGYRYVFIFVTGICVLGLLATLIIMRQSVRQKRNTDD
ncbi:MAG: MFS transporter [Planctomycetota bacterium]|jgi:nitrate/nitrite transporter NarK